MNNITIYPDKCKINKMSGISCSAPLEVEYEYSYDPGVHTYPNGDPGYPEYEEINIESIKCKGDLYDILCNYVKTQDLIDEIELKISIQERENN